jgi:hypothetical protein
MEQASTDFSSFRPVWAKRFSEIAKAQPKRLGLRPEFENPKALSGGVKFNFWAFFFSSIYYLIKGMWRKALVLIGINLLLVIGLSLFDPALANLAAIVVGALAATMANFDYYRKKVLHETFWF